MEHVYSHLGAAEISDLAVKIFANIVPILPTDEDDDRTYSYADSKTRREFQIHRSEELDDANKPCARFFMSEFVPTGVVITGKNKKGHVTRSEVEPAIAETEKRLGPNGLMQALDEAGIDTMNLVQMGGGYGVGSIFHSSLEGCAEEIAKSLAANTRYQYFRHLTDQEKVKMERSDAVQSHEYWKSERAAMDRALSSEKGVFKGCFTMFGSVSEEYKRKILAYLNNPSHEAWQEIRGYIVTNTGTLWQAWCAYNPEAPRSGNVGYPSKDELTEALRAFVRERDKEISARLKETSPVGLRAV
ncbi:hypothetical protein F6X40_40495 [Paraburkholderia sp. UCT31]|uniref:hypothetical protein n=1 Tax=Paraburkholderia sp. UCT31 TaxID=2615209 RepID=UPI001655E1BD|nr:hypothetical protein [Paraburkholderia sp. UCT31]MBC8742760.1 hypothetical protein [Paraburkholderia sp. UCT31]